MCKAGTRIVRTSLRAHSFAPHAHDDGGRMVARVDDDTGSEMAIHGKRVAVYAGPHVRVSTWMFWRHLREEADKAQSFLRRSRDTRKVIADECDNSILNAYVAVLVLNLLSGIQVGTLVASHFTTEDF